MKKLLTGILAAGLLFATAAVSAAPSVNGPTGLINTPSSDVMQPGDFSLGYYHLDEGGVGIFNISPAKNLEVGAAGFRWDDRDNSTYLNAKLGLVPETVLTPGLAVGVLDATDEDERSMYAVASKALPLGFRIHAGYGDGRYDGVFAAVEKTINPLSIITGNSTFPATTLIAEYDGEQMNYGARLSLVSGVKIDAGWRDHNFYAGASMSF